MLVLAVLLGYRGIDYRGGAEGRDPPRPRWGRLTGAALEIYETSAGSVLGSTTSTAVCAAVVASILEDADMLVDAGGWWMLLLFLVAPAIGVGSWLIPRLPHYLEYRRSVGEGARIVESHPTYEADIERYDAHLAAKGVKKVRGAKPRGDAAHAAVTTFLTAL